MLLETIAFLSIVFPAVDDLLIPLARRDVIAELPAERRVAAVVPVRFIA